MNPLIHNSDLKAIEKKAQNQAISAMEADLLRHKGLSESRIQQACKKRFEAMFGNKAKFIQIDNGGKMGIGQKIKKKREGTVAGAPDVMLIGKNKIAFVEFKRVGSPSEIEPTQEQKEMREFILSCGFPAYLCNNTVYFDRVICEEFGF